MFQDPFLVANILGGHNVTDVDKGQPYFSKGFHIENDSVQRWFSLCLKEHACSRCKQPQKEYYILPNEVVHPGTAIYKNIENIDKKDRQDLKPIWKEHWI